MRAVAAALVSHRSADLSLLERLVYDEDAARQALVAILDHWGAREAVILSTCQRVELYAVIGDASGALGLGRFLGHDRRVAWSVLRPRLSTLSGAAAARHLFRVAGGLDSLLVGERQIHRQVKDAYLLAGEAGAVGPELDGLFRWALNVGRRLRRETGLGSSGRSMGRVAVEAAARACGGLRGRSVLVLGAGKMARDVVDRVRRHGADLFVCSRGEEHASRLAGDEARVLSPGRLGWGIARADVVICCAASRNRLISSSDVAATMPARGTCGLTIVDLSIPRNADPAIGRLPGVRLIDLEELGRVSAAEARETGRADDPREQDGRLAAAEALVAAESERYLAWAAGQHAGPVIAALRRRAREVRPDLVHRVTLLARQAAASGDRRALADLCVSFGVPLIA